MRPRLVPVTPMLCFLLCAMSWSGVDAENPVRLRVLTFNIHHGEGVDGELDLGRIARVIKATNPDLVALQEVDQNATRSGTIDQPAELARLTKMSVAFGPNIPLQGGYYGNAVLSRHAITRHQNHQLPNLDQGEQRGILVVAVNIPGIEDTLHFCATHFDHRRDSAERIASAKAVNRLAASLPTAILAGDLNATETSETLKLLNSSWLPSNQNSLPTVPVSKPTKQIDFVLMSPANRWTPIETIVLDEAIASDHRAVLAIIEFQPEDSK